MKNKLPWENDIQRKNLAWFLPRPRPDHYKGGMPLHAESWVLTLAEELYGDKVRDEDILQPFAGRCKRGVRVDLNKEVEPDFIEDAHDMHFKDESFKIVLCDPPYSIEESEKLYGTPPPDFKRWTMECIRVLKNGGILILYHKKVLPNPEPSILRLRKRVFIGNRSWHLPRVVLFFQKVDDN